MAIELLDERKQWAKIKAGWNSSNRLFRNPPPIQRHPYANGRDSAVDQAQLVEGQKISSAFTGKTFSQRK